MDIQNGNMQLLFRDGYNIILTIAGLICFNLLHAFNRLLELYGLSSRTQLFFGGEKKN